jgi:hypothetical protein
MDMTKITPTNYRGFSIEQERDGSFSLFGIGGYISGNFKTIEAARANADWRKGA